DAPVDRVFHRTGIHFPIGYIAVAFAHLGADALDAEVQIGSGSADLDVVGLFHASLQRGHRPGHLGIIQGTHIEVEVLEGFSAHAGGLRHARVGPPQNAPPGPADAVVDHWAQSAGINSHALAGHIGIFVGVAAASNRDVSLHFLHPV